MASASAPSTSTGLGPLVRLWGLSSHQLPPATASGDALVPFLTAVLQEVVPFIDSAAPKSPPPSAKDSKKDRLWKPKGTKSHPDSAAPVDVSERRISAAELRQILDGSGGREKNTPVPSGGGEMWCCRRSVHADAAEPGSASWAEFDRCFRLDHAACEKAFTPSVRATHEAARWDCGGVRIAAPEPGGSTTATWGDFRLVLEEMRHRVGTGLQDRTFPVLQVSCVAAGPGAQPEFLFVSIPVPDFGGDDADKRSTLAAEPGALVAVYASVERVRKMPRDGGGGDGDIEWLMATASDARGVLPAWLQNLAMPAVIWKDVPLFLGWIAKERRRERERERLAEAKV
ncbi:hypothetical protein SLS62_005555 [Diatrype stigma]|uniref:DUF3074 domain-containing protein n=1 Tax=Diatrype stigma TaxID=117547 RepID=A0AAN9YRY4_9PEZI